jgi:hypothetical protein
MANIKNFKLLRNQTALASRAAAVSALEGLTLANEEGTLVLARYTENSTPGSVLGIVNLDGSVTVLDLSGEIQDAIQSLDSTLTLSGTAAQDAHFTQVAIVDGMLNPTTSSGSNIDIAHLVDLVPSNDANAILATTDTIHGALTKIEAAILGMDKAANAETGKVLTTVTQVDGRITEETKANVIDLALTGYSKEAASTGAISGSDDIQTALSKLENAIADTTVSSADQTITIDDSGATTDLSVNIDGTTIVKSNAGVLSADLELVQLTSAEVTALSDVNVKDAYKLIYSTDSNRTAIGGVVKIYKDSSLQEVYLGASTDTINAQTGVITKNTVTDPQSLNFAYQLADGTYSLVKIDVSKFLTESEFGDGLTVSGAGVVSVNAGDGLEFDSSDPKKVQVKVGDGLEIDSTSKAVELKIDSSSEAVTTGASTTTPVLSASSSGIKVDGIQDAIDYAVGELDAEAVKTGTVNGVAGTGTVTNNNLDLTVAGNNVPLTGYTALTPTGNAQETVTIAATDTTNQAFAKVEKAINVNEAVVAAALNDLDSTKVDVISVNGVQSKTPATGDVVASVTIDGGDVDLTGYTKPASTSAIAATDSVNEAIGKLEKGLENAVAGGVQSVTGVAPISVDNTDTNNPVVSLDIAASNGTSVGGAALTQPISVNANDELTFAEYLDAGYYAVS